MIQEEIRQKSLENDEESKNSSSASGTFYTAASSVLSDSYQTAFDTSFEELKKKECETFIKQSLDRYRKNVLMLGLVKKSVCNFEYNSESDGNFLDSSGSNEDVECQRFELEKQEKTSDNEKVYRGLYESKENEDVLCHPLREQIKEDSQWKKYRLKRKGVEEKMTPREYYFNIDDDAFNFVIPEHLRK